jgi:hypothetical protein
MHCAASVKNLRSEGGNLQPPDVLRSFVPDFCTDRSCKAFKNEKIMPQFQRTNEAEGPDR